MNEEIVLGGGCFWCLDASYRLIEGVTEVTAGYAGGEAKDAEYYTVSSGATNHAEVVRIRFDSQIIALTDILDIFWAIHDPTTRDQQGNDVGRQYRSAIFYTTEAQKPVVEQSVTAAQKLWDRPIVTEILPLEDFFQAEEYHQNYFDNHPEQAYCQIVINPKLQKLRQKFAQRLKNAQ